MYVYKYMHTIVIISCSITDVVHLVKLCYVQQNPKNLCGLHWTATKNNQGHVWPTLNRRNWDLVAVASTVHQLNQQRTCVCVSPCFDKAGLPHQHVDLEWLRYTYKHGATSRSSRSSRLHMAPSHPGALSQHIFSHWISLSMDRVTCRRGCHRNGEISAGIPDSDTHLIRHNWPVERKIWWF